VYPLNRILENIGCEYRLRGKIDNFATKFQSLFEADEGGLCWMRAQGDEAIELVKKTPCNIIICSEIEISDQYLGNKALVFVKNPHLAYLRLLSNLFGSNLRPKPGVHASAVISPDAKLGANVSVGPFVILGVCTLGDNCVIKSHAVVHDGVTIGSNVLISEHCNIGGEGFGFIKNEEEQFENMPHIGTVVIEDDVEIFPYTNVDRGTLGTTRIGRGTKIDHFCHIGHNSVIGLSNIITPNVTLLGGVKIGDQCMVGAGAALRDGVRVGNNVIIGMSSVVTKNISDNEVWVGSPARPIDEFKVLQKQFSEFLNRKI